MATCLLGSTSQHSSRNALIGLKTPAASARTSCEDWGSVNCPAIHVFYQDWSREKLEVVRESFKSGLILVSAERKPGLHHLYIGTRESIALQQTEGEHTSVLKAPAWDAHLADVEEQAFRQFEINRKRHGGFLLLVQTPEWEFLTAVEDPEDRTVVGPIQERSSPMPSGNP